MIPTTKYSLNRSNPADITTLLFRTDAYFEPTLSSRVEIPEYAQKLYNKAERFEAWMNQELIGLVATYCNRQGGNKTFVSSVSVLPDCQGQGIAKKLMHQCIEHVQDLGFNQIELEVNQRNLAALALYRKLGFITLHSSGPTLTMRMTLERQFK
jgi:ribosomal protein S18 acetylase RimI-like enzyme